MKLLRFPSYVVVVVALLCGGARRNNDAGDSAGIPWHNLTAAPWTLVDVTINGEDMTRAYHNVRLTFTPTAYITRGAAPLWNTSSVWTVKDNSVTAIVLGDGTEVVIRKLDASVLEVETTVAEIIPRGNRSRFVSRHYVFEFTR